MSGGLSATASVALTGKTGCPKETFTTCAVGRFSPKQPPSSKTNAQPAGTKIIRCFWPLLPQLHRTRFSILSCRDRQFDSKRRAAANLRGKIDRTVVKLYDPERAGQADAASSGPRGKEQLKNFLAILQRNAHSGVADGNFRHVAMPAERQLQLP